MILHGVVFSIHAGVLTLSFIYHRKKPKLVKRNVVTRSQSESRQVSRKNLSRRCDGDNSGSDFEVSQINCEIDDEIAADQSKSAEEVNNDNVSNKSEKILKRTSSKITEHSKP